MRRTLIIIAAVVGLVVGVAAAVLFYAASNLNSIIEDRRDAVMAKVSAVLGRDVKVKEIAAEIGWGVNADIMDVTIADDPAISGKPFVHAEKIFARLELLPLLAKRIEVTEVVVENPVIRIVRTAGGKLNLSTIGEKREESGQSPTHGASAGKLKKREESAALNALLIKNFTIEDGTLIYEQQGAVQEASVKSIDLHLKDFGFERPFTVDFEAAAFGGDKNVESSATIGPLLRNREIDVNAIPITATLKLGPMRLDQLKTIPQLASAIPPELSVSDPMSVDANATGTSGALNFSAVTDLSADQVAFGDKFNKPAGVPFKISGEGTDSGTEIEAKQANITLADMQVKASDIKMAGSAIGAHADSNSFDLGSIGRLVPMLGAYNLSGKSEFHTNVHIGGGAPSANGTVTLSNAGFSAPERKAPPLSNVNGAIKLTGTTADAGPITFNLGAASGTVTSHIDSIQPVKLSYDLSVPGSIHLADIVPSRPATDRIDKMTATGTLEIKPQLGPAIVAKINSPSGNVNRVPYSKLEAVAGLDGTFARLSSLSVDAFSGHVSGTGGAGLTPGSDFSASTSFTNLDLKQAMESQDLKAAETVRGTIGGNINLSGKAGSIDAMKPTLNGTGQLTLTNGKLIGVNVGAQALKKVNNLPVIGDLVPQSVIARHPELFSSPDTDIQIASLSFAMAGGRINTRDLQVQTVDYGMLGSGWFDIDKHVDMTAQIILSRSFSGELIAAKRNIQYLADRDGQVIVPLQVTGQLPKPMVLPNVSELAQRAGERAVEGQGQKLLGKLLGKKGKALGGIFGGDNSAPDNGGENGNGNGGGNNQPPPPNPLDQLKKFF
ncbi:MAG TPA: AsmA family protein [Candidatus Binataceae bacterium]|nr:AsmA family protein [Candidatus Binataceae bacterium]